MSCSGGSTILQMAHGAGSATFPHPTTPGSMIVQLIAFDVYPVNLLDTSDDAGNIYDISSQDPNFDDSTDMSAMQYSRFTMSAPLSAQTITCNYSGGGSVPWVWIYELNQTTENVCFTDINFSPPASANPSGSGLFLSPSCATLATPPGNCCVLFTVCACGGGGGVITGVAAPWTLDTVQGGNGAAYLIETNLSATDTAVFTAAGSTSFAISESGFEAVQGSVGTYCGCLTSPAVGNPLI